MLQDMRGISSTLGFADGCKKVGEMLGSNGFSVEGITDGALEARNGEVEGVLVGLKDPTFVGSNDEAFVGLSEF